MSASICAYESIPSGGCMCRGVVFVITGLHRIEYLQRIYRHIIPLLKMFEKSNFQNKSSSWDNVCSSLESVESPLSIH